MTDKEFPISVYGFDGAQIKKLENPPALPISGAGETVGSYIAVAKSELDFGTSAEQMDDRDAPVTRTDEILQQLCEALEDMLRDARCLTKGLEDIEAGCCSVCRARIVLSEHRENAALPLIDELRGGGWLPIESAPRDGTRIIVYRPKADPNYIPHVGQDYWMRTYHGSYCWGKSSADTPPTHYMLLPTPPTKGASDE